MLASNFSTVVSHADDDDDIKAVLDSYRDQIVILAPVDTWHETLPIQATDLVGGMIAVFQDYSFCVQIAAHPETGTAEDDGYDIHTWYGDLAEAFSSPTEFLSFMMGLSEFIRDRVRDARDMLNTLAEQEGTAPAPERLH